MRQAVMAHSAQMLKQKRHLRMMWEWRQKMGKEGPCAPFLHHVSPGEREACRYKSQLMFKRMGNLSGPTCWWWMEPEPMVEGAKNKRDLTNPGWRYAYGGKLGSLPRAGSRISPYPSYYTLIQLLAFSSTHEQLPFTPIGDNKVLYLGTVLCWGQKALSPCFWVS